MLSSSLDLHILQVALRVETLAAEVNDASDHHLEVTGPEGAPEVAAAWADPPEIGVAQADLS